MWQYFQNCEIYENYIHDKENSYLEVLLQLFINNTKIQTITSING